MKFRDANGRYRSLGIGGCSAVLATALGLVSVAAGAARVVQPDVAVAADAPRVSTLPMSRAFTLRDLNAYEPVRLVGIDHQVNFPVAIRNDEVVTGANLRLRFANSESLIWEWSHLTILVNGEVVGDVPMTAATAKGTEVLVPIDPRTLVGYSQLGLRAVMHYTRECEDPAHSTLWAVVANDSTLELEVRPIGKAGDLALLPGPFFDPHDLRHVRLPVVLPEKPTAAELEAAGIIASWFGSLAEYRGVDFPVYLGKFPPKGHAVLVGLRGRLPDTGMSRVTGVQVAIAPSPSDGNGRVLVVTADDAAGILAAARALTLGKQVFAGTSATITDVAEPAMRKAYDAPRWVPTDRVVRLGERTPKADLQVKGQFAPMVGTSADNSIPAIRVPYDLAPDLFYWRSKGAFVDLKYRYSPIGGPSSVLDVDINDQFARGIPIPPDRNPDGSEKWLAEGGMGELAKTEKFYIPGFRFGSNNRLTFDFNFEQRKKGKCEDIRVDYYRGAIDPDSTVDLTSLPHYTYLPDLALFADGAFPFSKYADLSQTVAVLPAQPDATEIESFLDVLGHVGNATGYPATRLRVTDPDGVRSMPDADLLVFGTPPRQPLLGEWAKELPVAIGAGGTQVKVVGPVEGIRARFDGRDLEGASKNAGRVITEAGKSLGAMVSFESPLKTKRTVVAFTALDGLRLPELARALSDPGQFRFVGGDLTLLNGVKVSNYALARQYGVGHLPFVLKTRYWFSQQPLILAMLMMVVTGILALLLYRLLHQLAQGRKAGR